MSGKIGGWHLNFLIMHFGLDNDVKASSFLRSGRWDGISKDYEDRGGSNDARGIAL